MDTIAIPAINFAAIMPEIILSVIAMALLLINVFVPSEQKAYLGYLSLAASSCRSSPSSAAGATASGGFSGAGAAGQFRLVLQGDLPGLPGS